ncbi:hypothetical protein Pmani_008594 [Petrolisthes manimaculis]|uniref:CUB domain-containing protein n=1 Tax=Petrolisthes manimaculis TaxID=1843537 RepID=A0AAE1Q6K2_9EUCA|nr:hypothetical protein Pmani_008594 [Petrolisthes manimaculis]
MQPTPYPPTYLPLPFPIPPTTLSPFATTTTTTPSHFTTTTTTTTTTPSHFATTTTTTTPSPFATTTTTTTPSHFATFALLLTSRGVRTPQIPRGGVEGRGGTKTSDLREPHRPSTGSAIVRQVREEPSRHRHEGLTTATTTHPGEPLQELRTLTEGEDQETAVGEVVTETKREGKVFLVLLKIQPDMCTTQDTVNTMGTCLPSKDCTNSAGTSSGTCAKGFGVCCIAQRTCGGSTTYNNTYFVNPGYSGTDTGTGACTISVNRVNSNICQLRLDFINFEVDQPDEDGNCVTDFLTVSDSTVPMICGDNTGQHMYVDVDPAGGPIRVTVDRSAASTTNRLWNIKISQIECNSANRGTRQIANTNYGVCVEMADGYCGIIWERNTTGGDYGFSMTGNPAGLPPGILGTPDASETGTTNCMTDYVIIPGGVTDASVQEDRYCGLGFPNSVTSTNKPFMLYVTTDEAELVAPPGISDINNSGFSLNYRQITNC